MAGEVSEVVSVPVTPVVSTPPSMMHSPAMPGRSPARGTPLGSPLRKAVKNIKGYLEEVGHITKLDPQDEWLPITESRNGNAYYAAFHNLCSGIGFQALVLPVAFVFLGWKWGIVCLTLAFIWQLYTLWLLVQLHEIVPGMRYSRYLQLANNVFGKKLVNLLAYLPIMYLSAGICSAIIIVGGGSMKLFFDIVCGATCHSKPLTAVEWYLVFTCMAVILAQLPNLNSIAGVSLVGAITAVSYCTTIWVVSVGRGRLSGVSYSPIHEGSSIDRALSKINALGIIVFAFRGHNLVLEIQATMPSTLKHPSRIPMWRGMKVAYLIVACCLYPIAIGGFWAYGNQIPSSGILQALYQFHGADTSRVILGLTAMLVVINCLSSFQIYAMPMFDNMESGYTSKKNKRCPRWLRSAFRAIFGAVAFLIAVAFPFLSDLAGLMGGVSLPVTLAFPCFMWVLVRKPERFGAAWYLNWVLGGLGMGLSAVLVIGGVWRLIDSGLKFHFFKPQ
ncbi:Lysine histidine transporter-like 8 [Platanthera guangdongensis]|uniref:Lysine histidine transporter-like 8 n=1 Tax=Platanthera guangdongensis TaxID=2320717 RepID=A0ABR2LPP0_9ASPA